MGCGHQYDFYLAFGACIIIACILQKVRHNDLHMAVIIALALASGMLTFLLKVYIPCVPWELILHTTEVLIIGLLCVLNICLFTVVQSRCVCILASNRELVPLAVYYKIVATSKILLFWLVPTFGVLMLVVLVLFFYTDYSNET